MQLRNKHPQLYGARRHPYYVVAPSFDRLSSGIRVMHQLCHTLNLLGEEAYAATDKTSPKLVTPMLTAEIRESHRRAGLNPIAIYPEIVGANPLDCDVVVRYILNKPGLFGEPPNYQKTDLFWLHNGEMVDLVEHVQGILHMPACDTSIFHNRDNPHDDQREGACIYFGRFKEAAEKYPELAANCTAITKSFPATHEDLAALLRRSTHVYCFENTSISMEARLCGCPVVQLPSPYVDLDNLFGASLDINDALVPDDQPETLAQARALLPGLSEKYVTLETNYWMELKRLVTKTQRTAQRTQAKAAAIQFTAEQAEYALWRKRRTLQEIDGELMAERMVSKWRFKPVFAIGIVIGEDDGARLADTIDSLAKQWYPEWQLVVFAPGLPAPAELAEIAQIEWLSDAQQRPGFASLRQSRDADFYAMLPAGSVLEDHALQAIADEINASPQWLAVYTDHDEAADNDPAPTPRFKPDFNPELLFSYDYIGASAFLCRELLDAFQDGAERLAASPYGLLLRTFEQTGSATIGHIADPLIHCTPAPRDDEGANAALAAHFDRRQVQATIEDGWFAHTRRVRFTAPETSSVSVIVVTSCEPGYLRCCIESLLETAGITPLELIVVAHRVTDPDLEAYLAVLADERSGIACKVLTESGEFRPAAFRNRAAQAAGGDYLLFIDDDTEFFHQGWLSALLGHAIAGALAAVGPRLVRHGSDNAEIVGGAHVLGMDGLSAPLTKGNQGILDTSCELRLQLDQAVSALPATCLLVDKKRFDALEGFDEEHAPSVLHDIDFSLRVQAAGGRLGWLASVDVAHHQGVTLGGRNREPAHHLDWISRQEAEKAALLERHLPALANDPNYNRNLSLRSPYRIDIEAVADWNPRFHDRPRLLGLPLTTGAGQYRVVAPLRALAKAGMVQSTIIHPVGDNVLRHLMPIEIARLAPDTVLMQNCVDDNLIGVLEQSSRVNRSVQHIACIDDRLGDLPEDNPLYPIHKRHGRSRLRKGLSYCNRLIVTTEALQEYCADLIEDIRLVPNRLEKDAWGDLVGVENEGKKPRVGWVGAMQHGGDLKIIEPVVRELKDEVEWVFMGMCPDFLKDFVKEVHPFVSIRDYPRKMASLALDLALAPLEIHPFNECKSNLRILEYGALGWPVLCTDISTYRLDSPPVTHLPNDPRLWIKAIRERVSDRDSLKAEGTLLRKWVNDNYMLEDGLSGWLAALTEK